MTIPTDIQKAAARVYAQLGRGPDADEQAIAKALQAERERGAVIADASAALSKGSGNFMGDGFGNGAHAAAKDIATAIRTPTTGA